MARNLNDKIPGDAYMKEERRNTYVACEHYNFIWERKEILLFRKLWNKGVPLSEIAKILGRHVNEVAILVIDQAEKKKIGMHASKRILGQAV
jgi:hypothetical protein